MARGKIIYVDDSEIARKFCSLALGKLGDFDVTTCECMGSALPRFGSEMPDLLLMDYWLKDSEGIDCLREIRSLYSEDQLPVVFVTASSDELLRARLVSAGALDVIFKPYTPAELAMRVSELLYQKQHGRMQACAAR